MPNLFRHLTDYARSHLTFSGIEKTGRGRIGRDCFVAALLAMTMFSPFFVSSSFAADNEMTVSVPEYVELLKSDVSTLTSDITVTDSSTLTLSSAIKVVYSVFTNTIPDFYLSITAPVQGGIHTNAWNGIIVNDNAKVVFTKNDNSASEAAVRNALGDNPVPESNANTIAFWGYPSMWSMIDKGVYASDNIYIRHLQYKQSNSIIHFDVGSNNRFTSKPGTFSPHDSAGIYTATVHITTVAP